MQGINVQAQIVIKESNDSINVDTAGLLPGIAALDKALLNKDSVSLDGLLSADAEIKHSNGWVQSKEDVFEDFRDSTLDYEKMECLKIEKVSFRANMADVKRTVSVKGRFKAYDFDMRLMVNEVWIYENGRWQLWSRKSEKIEQE